MAELAWIAALLISVVIWPTWIWRRMRKVRAHVHATEPEQATAPHHREQTEEVVAHGDDGYSLVRLHDGNADLIAADKVARELPGIGRTLAGQR